MTRHLKSMNEFLKDGYVVLDNQSRDLEDWARRESASIESRISSGILKGPEELPTRIDEGNYALDNSPPIDDAIGFLEYLLTDNYSRSLPVGSSNLPKNWQLSSALAGYPDNGEDTFQSKDYGMHVDGAGMIEGRVTYAVSSFILGILLTEINDDCMGNPCVWPGAHLGMKDILNRKPIGDALGDYRRGMIVDRIWNARNYGVETPPSAAKQIKGGPGTIIIYHYLMMHGIAKNTSPHNRHIVLSYSP